MSDCPACHQPIRLVFGERLCSPGCPESVDPNAPPPPTPVTKRHREFAFRALCGEVRTWADRCWIEDGGAPTSNLSRSAQLVADYEKYLIEIGRCTPPRNE